MSPELHPTMPDKAPSTTAPSTERPTLANAPSPIRNHPTLCAPQATADTAITSTQTISATASTDPANARS